MTKVTAYIQKEEADDLFEETKNVRVRHVWQMCFVASWFTFG